MYLEDVEGRLCLPSVPEVMRCVPLCILEEDVEGRLCSLSVLSMPEALQVLQVRAGRDALYATLYSGGCGG